MTLVWDCFLKLNRFVTSFLKSDLEIGTILGGGRRDSPQTEFLGGCVSLGSPNLDPILDQNMQFFVTLY